jgi:predicted XRE-type DNA-binding protein
MAVKKSDSEATGVLRELEDIKHLLLLGLLRSGVSQAEVAKTLGVNQSSISRMFPRAGTAKAKTRKAGG